MFLYTYFGIAAYYCNHTRFKNACTPRLLLKWIHMQPEINNSYLHYLLNYHKPKVKHQTIKTIIIAMRITGGFGALTPPQITLDPT